MNRVSPSWSEFFSHSEVLTIQVRRNGVGELQGLTIDGLTAQGTARTLRLFANADATTVDLLEAAVEVLATQMRREIEGPRSLW